jgi:hypothetical protein
MAALARVRDSGRKLVLVTGRVLPDLRHVCPGVDEMFDGVVAENGAVLYFPATQEVRVLGDSPQPALIEELRRREVPHDLGSSLVATLAPFAEEAVAAIREAGVERTLVFNKGALMLLPGGVTKATGLAAALAAMGFSARNVAAIGDGENDHAFLSVAEVAVAVADAVPALRHRADFVTREPGPRGARAFIEEHVLEDAAALAPTIARHFLTLGERPDATPLQLPPHGTHLLVVGPTGSGKSTLTGVLVERLVESGRTVCLLDPEGDYQSLGELEDVVVLGGKSSHALPAGDELAQRVRRPRAGLVLNLSTMSRAEKVEYGAAALSAIGVARTAVGLPHWLIIDEAHHILPAQGSPGVEVLKQSREPVCLITLSVDDVASGVHTLPTTVVSTDRGAFDAALRSLGRARGGEGVAGAASIGPAPLARGEAAIGWLNGSGPGATRFRVAPRRVEHRRHARKYSEGELPPERSFYFRGRENALNLRAANLLRFCELAAGVDLATWEFHLRRGDYSAWAREMIKDPALAMEIARLEANGALTAEVSRRDALAAIRRRYAV